jgi:protein-tyrosine phosphatase
VIDLRCHILDGMQCGPESFDEALDMGRSAVAEGIKTVVATPRWDMRRVEPPVPFSECQKKVKWLSEELRGTLVVKLGFVLPFSRRLPELAERHGRALTLGGGRHLLVTLPYTWVNEMAEEVWDELEARGFSVVISGPECSPALRRDPARFASWVSRGFFLQLNAASIMGTYGREVRRFALECLQQHERNVVVTLNMYGKDARKRSLGVIITILTAQLGKRRAELFLRKTPIKILGGGDTESDFRNMPEKNKGLVSRTLQPLKSLIGI